MSAPRISVIAIEDHPDIPAVVGYLRQIGAIPVFYEDTAFACPFVPGDEIEYFKKTAVFHSVGPIPTWSLYVKGADTVVVLAGCDDTDGERQVAEYYSRLAADAAGVSPDSVRVTLSGDPEPFAEYAAAWIAESAAVERMADNAVRNHLPGAKVENVDLHPEEAEIWISVSYKDNPLVVRITPTIGSAPAFLYRTPVEFEKGVPLRSDLADLQEKADVLLQTA